MWSGRCHLAPWSPPVIRWHNDIGDLSPPPSGCQLMSGKNKLWVHKQVPSAYGSFSLARRHQWSGHTSPIREICPWAARLPGCPWSLGVMPVIIRCDWSVPRVGSHCTGPGAPHKWSVLAVREAKCLFYAYCICLEITIGELHTNTICIKFTSNNGSSPVIFGYFCIWYSDFVWFGGIISIPMKYKFHLQIGLCCKIRLHCPPPSQPRQVTLLTPLCSSDSQGKLWTFWYRLMMMIWLLS